MCDFTRIFRCKKINHLTTGSSKTLNYTKLKDKEVNINFFLLAVSFINGLVKNDWMGTTYQQSLMVELYFALFWSCHKGALCTVSVFVTRCTYISKRSCKLSTFCALPTYNSTNYVFFFYIYMFSNNVDAKNFAHTF